jgi:xylan 1,4-beta-xylosidase
VFLASRPYRDSLYNTGRETYLLPVEWKDGWPVILPKGKPIPELMARDAKASRAAPKDGPRITVAERDEFEGPTLRDGWLQVHVPKQDWFDLTSRPGTLTIRPLAVNLDAKRNTSFLARRQQDLKFVASTELAAPTAAGVSAGLAAFQNERYWYFLGTRRIAQGLQVFLERRAGEDRKLYTSDVIEARKLKLRISADGGNYSFHFDAGNGWQAVRENDDGSILSTEIAGGFVGTVLGPFARQE